MFELVSNTSEKPTGKLGVDDTCFKTDSNGWALVQRGAWCRDCKVRLPELRPYSGLLHEGE